MINLSIQFHHPDAASHFVQYARIDNLAPGANPSFVTVSPNPVTSPAIIATNIPNGQYQIQSTPVYLDGRTCQPTVQTTPACPGLTSVSAAIQGNVIVINYVAPSAAPKVRITVNYPNGGSTVANYVNTGTAISIGIPAGVYGSYSIFGQSVCDETSGFYSLASSTVTVTYSQPILNSLKVGATSSAACSATASNLYSNGPFAPGVGLFYDAALTNPVTGLSFAVNLSNNHIYNLSSSGIVGSDTGNTCSGNAILTFRFVNAGGSFLNFQASLNTPIDGNISINRVFADGFSDTLCNTAVSSAQKNTVIPILAGATSAGSSPDAITGTWASAIKSTMYNVIVNGLPVLNGTNLNIGSYTVTMVIPSCA